jgi:carbon storage regulator CsrA
LCLTRKLHERVLIDGGRIVVEVIRIERGQVGLAFSAARDIPILRGELSPRTPGDDGRGGSR